MSLEQTFPPRGRNCEHKLKGRRATEAERETALDRAGIRNLGDPNGPPGPTKKSKNKTPSDYGRKYLNITEL